MTDKELFEKTEKHFDLKKSDKINKIFEEGNFNKVLNEIKGPKQPTGIGKATGGFLSRVAAAIPGTRGHRMRSAEARKQVADAKRAEIEARTAQQRLMKGNYSKNLNKLKGIKNDINRLKVGDEVGIILKTNKSDNVARIVKIIKITDDTVVVNDTGRKNSSNYTIMKKNIREIKFQGS